MATQLGGVAVGVLVGCDVGLGGLCQLPLPQWESTQESVCLWEKKRFFVSVQIAARCFLLLF